MTLRARLLHVFHSRSRGSAVVVVLSAGDRRPARAAAVFLILRVCSPTLHAHKPASIRSSPARARLGRALHARPRLGELFQSIPLLVITQLTTLGFFIARIGDEQPSTDSLTLWTPHLFTRLRLFLPSPAFVTRVTHPIVTILGRLILRRRRRRRLLVAAPVPIARLVAPALDACKLKLSIRLDGIPSREVSRAVNLLITRFTHRSFVRPVDVANRSPTRGFIRSAIRATARSVCVGIVVVSSAPPRELVHRRRRHRPATDASFTIMFRVSTASTRRDTSTSRSTVDNDIIIMMLMPTRRCCIVFTQAPTHRRVERCRHRPIRPYRRSCARRFSHRTVSLFRIRRDAR